MSKSDQFALKIIRLAIVFTAVVLLAFIAHHIGAISSDTLGLSLVCGLAVYCIWILLHVANRIAKGDGE